MFKTIIQIFKVSGVQLPHFIFLIVGSFFVSITEVLSISSIYPIVSSLVLGKIPSQLNFISEIFPDYNLVLITFSLFCILFIIKNITILCFLWFSGKYIYKLQTNLMGKIFKTYLSKDLRDIFNLNKAVIIRNINFGRDLTKSLDLIVKVFIEIFTASTLILLIYLVVEIKIFLFLSLIIISVFLIFGLLREKLKIWGKKISRLQADILKIMNETFEGVKEIKIFNVEKYFTNIFNLNNFKSFRLQLLKNVSDQLPKVIVETSAIIIFSALVFYIIFVKSNSFSNEMLPLLGMLGLIILRLIPAFSKILYSLNQIKFLTFQTQILSDINWDSFQSSSKSNFEDNENQSRKNMEFNNIVLKDVSFSYDNSQKGKIQIFNNFNLEIRKNEFVGIIGPSGSGKTTLVKLILGLINPDTGKILFDKNKMKQIYKNVKVSFVFQDSFLIDDSLIKNICLGEDEAKFNRERFIKSVNDAELNSLIENKLEKEKFRIGENGNMLSQGQKQRVAIARALYFSPEILVLDEPTSSLDEITEKKVVNCINKLKGSKTIFFISHKMDNLEKCDKIINIQNSEIKIREK